MKNAKLNFGCSSGEFIAPRVLTHPHRLPSFAIFEDQPIVEQILAIALRGFFRRSVAVVVVFVVVRPPNRSS
jgi:hypothetical protein